MIPVIGYQGKLYLLKKLTTETVTCATCFSREFTICFKVIFVKYTSPFSSPDDKLSPNWPKSGKVQFIDLSLQYNDDEPPVLKELSFTINSGEKVGPYSHLVRI